MKEDKEKVKKERQRERLRGKRKGKMEKSKTLQAWKKNKKTQNDTVLKISVPKVVPNTYPYPHLERTWYGYFCKSDIPVLHYTFSSLGTWHHHSSIGAFSNSMVAYEHYSKYMQ